MPTIRECISETEHLAFTYAEAGRFDEALATASKGRDLALASGQNELAEKLLKLIEACKAGRVSGGMILP